MNKTFTIDNRTFKQVPSIDGCIGCGGSFSKKACTDLKDKMDASGVDYRSCVGSDGVIYVEVKE